MIQYHQQLNEIINNAGDKIKEISTQDFNSKTNPSKWSKKEILGHLIDSAYNNHRRLVMGQSQGHLTFDGYDQDHWAIANPYQGRKTSDIIQTWAVVNRHLGVLIDHIPRAQVEKKTTNHNYHKIGMRTFEESEAVNLAMLIEDYIFHTEYHLAQIIPDYQRVSTFT